MSEYEDDMCDEGYTRLTVAKEMDDERPHGQVTAMNDRFLNHLRECVVCRDALGEYADLLLTISNLADLD